MLDASICASIQFHAGMQGWENTGTQEHKNTRTQEYKNTRTHELKKAVGGFLFGFDADGVGGVDGVAAGQGDGDGEFYLAGAFDMRCEGAAVELDVHPQKPFFG
ncbi:MAG: hypothetical protein ACYSO7_04900 [Planctomycetota bacterium]